MKYVRKFVGDVMGIYGWARLYWEIGRATKQRTKE